MNAASFICERLALTEAPGPKPRRGWPVYSNARTRKPANPVGVTCARCTIVASENHHLKPLDSTWVTSSLRGLASIVSTPCTINGPPPPGFGDSVTSGLSATWSAQAISNAQASSQQLWVMPQVKTCPPSAVATEGGRYSPERFRGATLVAARPRRVDLFCTPGCVRIFGSNLRHFASQKRHYCTRAGNEHQHRAAGSAF
jgi:hypothetical protein